MAPNFNTVVNFYQFFVGFSIYLLFRFCRLCLCVLDFIIRKIAIETRQSRGNTAQYGRILWRRKIFVMDEPASIDFLCLFASRVKPDYVLRQNVTLYALTGKEAIFVETPKRLDIYSSNTHPFSFVGQFLYAKSVIKMSITDFVALAEQIGDPAVPVMWISNTGRCGGTMLCQIFESVPGTLLIHEPHAALNLCHLRESGSFIGLQYDNVLKSTIRVFCKPRHGIKYVCIKPEPICAFMMNDITRLMPNVRQLFMYRNSLSTVRSWVSTQQCEPFLAVMTSCANSDWFSGIFPLFRRLQLYYYISKLKDGARIQPPSDADTACVFTYMWAYSMLTARDAIARNPNILPVKYENVVARPKEVLKELFIKLGIDVIHLEKAITSMKRDSQRNSVVSRDKLDPNNALSTKDKIQIDSILSKFNLPLSGEDFWL